MAIATARMTAAPVNTIPSARTRRSRSLGTMMITSAPATGSSVVIVIADLSHPLIEPPLSSSSDQLREDHGQHEDADEQERHVALDVAGLDVLQQTSGEAGGAGHPVHRTVDHATVEQVHDLRQTARERTHAVHHAVEHTLVEPVDAGREAVAHRVDDRPH